MKNSMTNPHEYGVNSPESGSLILVKVEKLNIFKAILKFLILWPVYDQNGMW